MQGKKLKQLQHFLSWNKANIKYSCKSQLYCGSNSSSEGSTIDKEYTSGVPGIPLEVFQKQLRTRATSRSRVGTSSAPLSTPLDEVGMVYSWL